MQSSSLYTLCLFSIPLNENIVEIEKPGGIFWLTLVADEFSVTFLHPSFFCIIYSRSA